MGVHVRSPFFDPNNARSEALPPQPRDLSTVTTPDEFKALSMADRARLYNEDADRYRQLRDANILNRTR